MFGGNRLAAGLNGLVLSHVDNILVGLIDLIPGQHATYEFDGEIVSIQVVEPIPIYHKIAITTIDEGSYIYKYGQVIGRAVQPIKPGQHVHTHNLVSIREFIE